MEAPLYSPLLVAGWGVFFSGSQTSSPPLQVGPRLWKPSTSLPGLSPTPASSFHLPDVVVVVVVGLTLPCLFPPPSRGQARPAPLAVEGGR